MKPGLSASQAHSLLQQYGYNEITAKHNASPLLLFWSQFPTVINGILALAALLSFFVGDAIDTIFIFAILFLNAVLGFYQEYRAEKSLEKLKAMLNPLVRVIRDGKEQQISSRDLVPGDIVFLFEGERVPADGAITKTNHLEIDESVLTGESLPVEKEPKAQILSGTLVTKGNGYMVVEKTGMTTRFGQIAETLATVEEDTSPLKKQVNGLGKVLSAVAFLFAFLVVPVGLSQGRELFPLILLSVSVAIAAIPEGLPAVITIALAIGTSKMAKKGAIIRKLPAVETLGSVQILLFDKTGTLTQNKMQVKEHWTLVKNSLPRLFMSCVVGNTATLIEKGVPNEYDVIGDTTDGALLLYGHKNGLKQEVLEKTGKLIDEYVFDPITKTITIVWQEGDNQTVFIRGAPEEVLGKSIVTEKERKQITEMYESFALKGLRVIGFATKTKKHGHTSRKHLENNLTFLGLIGIYDPPRLEAKQAILSAKEAGIRPIMVTGDNELTALTIGREVGLIDENDHVITGNELSKISDDELSLLLDTTNVFSRVQPEDKLRLTSLFKKKGYIVGVTGDGVNDALALKRADVGIAMGIGGTDVAKEAADIVLTDNNFATLVHAIMEGRVIYNNISKAIVYLLAGNLSEILFVLLTVAFGLPVALLPTQILWINLVTDGIPALALASDTGDSNVVHQKPRNISTPILTPQRLLFILTVGGTIAIILCFVFYVINLNGNSTLARTVTFNLLVALHLCAAFIVRGKNWYRKNPLLMYGTIATIVLQAMITLIPSLQEIFHLGFN